jgi:hypothetical protein
MTRIEGTPLPLEYSNKILRSVELRRNGSVVRQKDIYCTCNKNTFTLIRFRVLLTGYIARYSVLVQNIKCDPVFILVLWLMLKHLLHALENFHLQPRLTKHEHQTWEEILVAFLGDY